MRVLHTSDWHLGHALHDQPRDREHASFLEWLGHTLEAERVDALLIAGDVFDTANPSAAAQASWYGFLADIRERMPGLDVVVIGGNHDSAARLNAPVPLLRRMRIHVVGGLPRRAGDQTPDPTPGQAQRAPRRTVVDVDRLIAPLHDANGEVGAYVAAVPFLRISDLPRLPSTRPIAPDVAPDALADVAPDVAPDALADVAPDALADVAPDALADVAPDGSPDALADEAAAGSHDPLIWGVRRIYTEALDAARARCTGSQALLAMGHCYMVGTELSRLSERRILGGNQHALPVHIFPDDVAYVALGHLHKAQRVGGREGVRYCGAPIPLSLEEGRNRQQVLLVELDGPQLVEIRSLPVPRAVEVLRVPKQGTIELDDVVRALGELEDMPAHAGIERHTRPYLEVCVRLSRPEVRLREMVEKALENKLPRLVKLTTDYPGDGGALGDVVPGESLRDLLPAQVFQRLYQRDHEDEPAAELLAAFDELLDEVGRQETR